MCPAYIVGRSLLVKEMEHVVIGFKRVARASLLLAIASLPAVLFSLPSMAWIKEGKWSTGYYKCGELAVKLSVDMTTRIGGSEVVPIREAYLKINGKNYPSVWIVGGDNNSAETNNRAWKITFWKNISLDDSYRGVKYTCRPEK